jgi:hypothetical protein
MQYMQNGAAAIVCRVGWGVSTLHSDQTSRGIPKQPGSRNHTGPETHHHKHLEALNRSISCCFIYTDKTSTGPAQKVIRPVTFL